MQANITSPSIYPPMDWLTRLNKPVFLVGLMGCGKSSIGHLAAEQWHIPFFDIDKVIEEKEGCTVSELFDTKGEAYFRQKELDTVKKLVKNKASIVATGGGAFVQPNLRGIILEHSISVWLKADFSTLLERVSRKNTRPLLEKGDKATILNQLLMERTPSYEKADIIVTSDSQPHQSVVNQMAEKLQEYIDNNA